ncbi:hypothetical protein VIGAN_UM165700 [Vigna angularis var. angularis]|uniref:Uncharacterized protein n=1 Tax=Vigna angularis var. angularis TaxID=157739 RepID=A0A0S3TFH2_PHAAN|nr:hypothetical protein VIGAN_UM165700 [Vigna angularis var. angularis]
MVVEGGYFGVVFNEAMICGGAMENFLRTTLVVDSNKGFCWRKVENNDVDKDNDVAQSGRFACECKDHTMCLHLIGLFC